MESDLPPGLECFCPPLPHQLLYISHVIHDEVLPLLYGENRFKVSPKKNDLPNHHLNSLWVLSPVSWRTMKTLHICLTDCERWPFAAPWIETTIEMLNGRTAEGSTLISEWAALCEHMASQIPVSKMNFSFYCTVNDTETGVQITKPLKKFSPMMWPAINLSPDPDNRVLKEVARMAALQLMGKDED